METEYKQAKDLFEPEELACTRAKVDIQILVENICNKQQQRNLIRKRLRDRIEPILQLVPEELHNIFLDILGIMALRKEALLTTVVEMVIEKDEESIKQTKLEIANTVILLVQLGLLKGNIINDNIKLYCNFGLDEETKNIMANYQFLPPMLVEPLPVGKNNRGSGYLTKANDSLVLNNNWHNSDICTEFLDVLNKTGYSLNTEIIRNVRNTQKGLDKPKQPEDNKGRRETQEEWQERVKAFEAYERECLKMFAFLVHQGNQFWFTHKYDKRGRVYCCGYHVNYQGNAYQKAIVEFHKKTNVSDQVDWFE